MESKIFYASINKLEEVTNLKCLHLELDMVSKDLLINILKPLMSDYEFAHYYIYPAKSGEINADSKNIFLGALLLGTDKPISEDALVHVFQKFAQRSPQILHPSKEHYLAKDEYVLRYLQSGSANKETAAPTEKRKYLNIKKNKADEPTNNVNTNIVNNASATNIHQSTVPVNNNVEEEKYEDLNEAARNFDDYTYGVINNNKHIEKVSSIEGVEILGINNNSHCTYFKVPSENTNKVLGQSVRIQKSVLDSELLDFYKND